MASTATTSRRSRDDLIVGRDLSTGRVGGATDVARCPPYDVPRDVDRRRDGSARRP
ncbi:hypothetical protein [Georgenia yuyongxinii]